MLKIKNCLLKKNLSCNILFADPYLRNFSFLKFAEPYFLKFYILSLVTGGRGNAPKGHRD